MECNEIKNEQNVPCNANICRGANLEEAEIVVRCLCLIRGVRGVEKVGCVGPHRPPWKQF